MKSITITSKRIKNEIKIALTLLIIAIGINCYAIIKFDTQWSEIFTQMGYVLAIGIFLYLLSIFIRGVLFLIKRLIKKE